MHPAVLLSRSLLNRRNTSKHVCPKEDESGPAIVPFIGNLTYHQFAMILSGTCAAFSALVVALIIAMHAHNYSNPVQQRQIIRIMLLVPWVALFSFLIVWREDAGDYLTESLDFGCSIALASFLLLMCDFVLSHRGGFDDLFGQGAWSKSNGADKSGTSPLWLKRMWYGVLQYIPTSIILWIAAVISLAVGSFCRQSNSVHFANIWITVIKGIISTMAIVNTLKFYKQNKAKLHKHQILMKLFTIHGIVTLNFLQTFIISILVGNKSLKPSKYLTYHDVNTSLSSLILACEMPLFACLLLFVFSPQQYTMRSPAAGSLSAIVDAFNITDLLSAFVRGPMRLVKSQQKQIARQDSMTLGTGARPEASGYEEIRV
ncbi:uncharacterized protein K460DRAFT_393833 [Cucurbitaria berberidis CBS 394.84]|uniref:DUF300-domain-containing protein n=1 Tax=Cucurbitaria berberidis CBS 394.84 TaxID=1168544 RepID=A0A9P4GM15_9PLEO|nr:uncharacterized protein K460DRAFT_393833 [Cucurbitaria berberidis CBS 394.84]KAF1848863.1 hypothetical protein K460DRAFT_393833 [Cucurbitaria berberidis CBS 394.84]